MLHARKRPIHLHYSHIVPRSKSHGVAARFARYLLRVYTNIRNDTQIVCMCVSLPSVSTARRFFFLLAMAYGRQRVDARTYDDVPSIGIGVCMLAAGENALSMRREDVCVCKNVVYRHR